MTTPEPPDEPSPPSFEKPTAGGSPYGTPPLRDASTARPSADQWHAAGRGRGPLYDPSRSGTNPYGTSPYGPTPYGAPPVSAMPPLGGLGHRLLARIIDGVLLAIVAIPLSVVLYAGSGHGRTGRTLLIDLFLALLGFFYEGLMLTLAGGQTVGKKVMRIRVAVLADGSAPTGRTGWIRSAVYWLPSLFSFLIIPALFSLLNVLWCVWDRPYRQCLHDKAAKTVVVRTN
ncbi:RDD family protein [Streptacidiphilus sp. 4-A2]|nr:RDD family protein [Streptacidiphilus sp. 4-A2]